MIRLFLIHRSSESGMSLATRQLIGLFLGYLQMGFSWPNANNMITSFVTHYFNEFIKKLIISRTWPARAINVVPFGGCVWLLHVKHKMQSEKQSWQDMNMQLELQNHNYPLWQHWRDADHEDSRSLKGHVFEVIPEQDWVWEVGGGLAIDKYKHLIRLFGWTPSNLGQEVDFSCFLWCHFLA